MSEKKDFPADWDAEFQRFLSVEPVSPGQATTRRILGAIQKELRPSPVVVFRKLAIIQIAVAGVIVLFCPQLGVGPLLVDIGLMAVFMRFGSTACASLCGTTFLGASIFFSAMILKPAELKIARTWAVLFAMLTSTLTLMALMLASRSPGDLEYFGWVLGGSVGGWASLQLAGYFRLRGLRDPAPL